MSKAVVTRKGQATTPSKPGGKHRIEEGTLLKVIDEGRGILFKPKKRFLDLAGSGAERATAEEMKRLLDRMREEDA